MEELVPPDMFIREKNSCSIKNGSDCFFMQNFFNYCLTLWTVHNWNTTSQVLRLYIFSHIPLNQSWQGISNLFYCSQLYDSWQSLTVAEVSVELQHSLNRGRRRLGTAGCGRTSRCSGSLIWAPGLQWVGQHGETVLHQLEQQNSALQHLLSLTETKTCTKEPDHAKC